MNKQSRYRDPDGFSGTRGPGGVFAVGKAAGRPHQGTRRLALEPRDTIRVCRESEFL